MSTRERVQEQFTEILFKDLNPGYRYHFSHGDPVVHDADGNTVDPAPYWKAKELADKLYGAFLDRVDWNRAALETISAWWNLLDQEEDEAKKANAEFGHSARRDGQAMRLAFSTLDTYPNDYTEAEGSNG